MRPATPFGNGTGPSSTLLPFHPWPTCSEIARDASGSPRPCFLSGPFRADSGETCGRWFVVDGDGLPVGWVEYPERGRPLWVSDEGMIWVRVDDLDVPYVEWWPTPAR
jgi:hypothetical protein